MKKDARILRGPIETRNNLSATNEVESGFTVEIDSTEHSEWNAMVQDFDDGNIYQTWGCEVERNGDSNLSHLVLKKNARVVAMAQARIMRIPFLGTGVAYFRWGPLWKGRNAQVDKEIFREILRAIRREYLVRRGLAIRMVPHLWEDGGDSAPAILQEEGYVLESRRPRYRTILMDIRPSMDELYRGVHQKWRNCLNSSRKQKLDVLDGTEDSLFEAFKPIYAEMQERKRFTSYTDLTHFRRSQSFLPPRAKMRVVLCRVEGEICAGAICSGVGAAGLYIFGATSKRGMKTNGSYLVQWRMLEWLKEQGCQWYNLNGINPLKNEGTYRFKARLAGAYGHDVHFLGQFDAYPNAATKWLLSWGEVLRARLRKIREGAGRKDRKNPEEKTGYTEIENRNTGNPHV